jgi:type I restriction enzyme M protein
VPPIQAPRRRGPDPAGPGAAQRPTRRGGTQGYDLSLNRYKELVHVEVDYRLPMEMLAELRGIEQELMQELMQGIEELEGMLR